MFPIFYFFFFLVINVFTFLKGEYFLIKQSQTQEARKSVTRREPTYRSSDQEEE